MVAVLASVAGFSATFLMPLTFLPLFVPIVIVPFVASGMVSVTVEVVVLVTSGQTQEPGQSH